MAKKTVLINQEYVALQHLDEVGAIASKYNAMHKISEAGGFIAPQVLEVREHHGEIDLEKIDPIENLRSLYLQAMSNASAFRHITELLKRVGGVLGNIHNNLATKEQKTNWQPSTVFCRALHTYGWLSGMDSMSDGQVQLHGDFGFANIFLKPKSSSPPDVVVLDPCSDGYSCLDHWCYGPRELDIGKMLLSLEGKVSLRQQIKIRKKVINRLQKAFIEGYESEIGNPVDVEKCFAFSYALGACYFMSRSRLKKNFGLTILFNDLWKDNYPINKKLETYHGNI